MAKILITYSTIDGHTQKICQKLQQITEQDGHQTELLAIDELQNVDLQQFDKIVIGASIRYGLYRKEIFEFINSNLSLLKSIPSAFFSVNMVARKANKNRPETNPYLQKFLKQSQWQPEVLEVFAGQIDYPRYGFLDRIMIQFIMLITRGPTDAKQCFEFTDWKRVGEFAHTIEQM